MNLIIITIITVGFWFQGIPQKFLLTFDTNLDTKMLVKSSVCRFKSLLYYRRRHLSALQTMEMPLDGDKYDWLLNLQTLVKSGAIENIFKSQEPFQSYQLTGPA